MHRCKRALPQARASRLRVEAWEGHCDAASRTPCVSAGGGGTPGRSRGFRNPPDSRGLPAGARRRDPGRRRGRALPLGSHSALSVPQRALPNSCLRAVICLRTFSSIRALFFFLRTVYTLAFLLLSFIFLKLLLYLFLFHFIWM